MDYLRNWREYVPIKDRISVLALVAVIVIGFADVFLVRSSIIPRWQDRGNMASQLAAAEKDLEKARKAQEASPDELRKQIATAQAKLNDVAGAFLSDSQAAEVRNKLYQYASESQVEIANLQTQPPPEEKTSAYAVTKFRLQANGAFPNLMDFLSRIEEAAFESFVMTNVNLTEGEKQDTLSMDITLYTSPYSSGAVVQPTPIITPTGTPVLTPAATPLVTPVPTPIATPTGTPVPTPVATPIVTPSPVLSVEEQLAQSLHEPWAVKDWEEVISLIEQILAINPDYDDMNQKLYAAHVNYGRQLAAEGKLEEAKEEFTRALEIKPDGGEAIAELKALAGETPAPPLTPTTQPQYTIHVVQPGEWLLQIARMYGTTAQAIMAANGLTSSTIYPGQRLRIPIP
jgi:LysM repeat protein